MAPEEAEIRRWLEKARNDVQIAEMALAHLPPITDAGAFHCQQAVEKLLKAFLVSRECEFEKIHDLEVLAEQCAQYDAQFDVLRKRVDPLTLFAVRFRYPGPADPSVEQAQAALAVVREVWDFVVDRLPRDARP